MYTKKKDSVYKKKINFRLTTETFFEAWNSFLSFFLSLSRFYFNVDEYS